VLHHQNGIAHVAQSFQRIQQAAVIARVQANGGFVQNVKHAHQFGTHLGCQADALGFAARKSARAAFKRQVVQADINQKPEARVNFAQDAFGNGFLPGVERGIPAGRQRFHPFKRSIYRPAGHIDNIRVLD